MKKTLLLFLLVWSGLFSYAQCVLQVIGFNSDNPDQVLLYAAGNIPANTIYYLTDNEWNSGTNTGFSDLNETEVSWTSPPGGVSAGHYILLQGATATCGTATGTPALNANGDQIYITTIPPATTGMTEADVCLALDYSVGTTGMSPNFTGTNIELGATDNAYFTGTSFSEAAIEMAANWTLSGSPFDLINLITIQGAAACTNPTSVQFVNITSSFNENNGMVNVCVIIQNSNAQPTTVEVALAGNAGTASVGDYSASPVLPATLVFPASSPNGTQLCITLTGVNDVIPEVTETIRLILQNPGNGALDINQLHTATLLDDDIPSVIISEIMYDPCSGGGTNFWPEEGDGEFVEIYNNGATTIDISGWVITDNDNGSFNFIFPGTEGSNTTTIAPGEYIVIARQVLYFALDGNGDGLIDVGNPGAGSKIFNEDIQEGVSAGGDLNNDTDDIELKNALGTLIDAVIYSTNNPWPTCAGVNDGISLVLTNPDLDNSLGSNWSPSLTSGTGASGGGSPGAANPGGACISNVSTSVTQSGCGTPNPTTTVRVNFTTAYSAVSAYDIYQDGIYLGTYDAGSNASGTYMYFSPNLAPINNGSVNFEVRPVGAPANSCYSANSTISIPGCPLPIELMDFIGIAGKKEITLHWKTTSEKDNAYMAVERSKNGIHFAEIGRVKGHGSTTEPREYQLVDQQPLPGINYYRLKQVDYDDRMEYHKIISMHFSGKIREADIQIYPTAAVDQLTIIFPIPFSGKSSVSVYDIAGRLLQQQQLDAHTSQHLLNVNKLPKGYYVVVVQSAEKQEVARFVKL